MSDPVLWSKIESMLRQKPGCALRSARDSVCHALSDVPHSVCEASAKCSFHSARVLQLAASLLLLASVGLSIAHGDYAAGLHRMAVGGYTSALAEIISWDSVLEGIFRGSPRRGSTFSQCR